MDATIASIIVQQGRKDPVNGHQDIQCFTSVCFGISMGSGALFAAYTTKIGKPTYGFGLGAIVTAIVTFLTLFMDGESYEKE